MPKNDNGEYVTEKEFVDSLNAVGPFRGNGPPGNTTDCVLPFAVPLGIIVVFIILPSVCSRTFRDIIRNFFRDPETELKRNATYWVIFFLPTTVVAGYQLFQILQSFGMFNSFFGISYLAAGTDWSFTTTPRCVPLFSSIRMVILSFPSSVAHYRMKDGIASARLCTDAPATFVSSDGVLVKAIVDPLNFNNCSRQEIANSCTLSDQYYPPPQKLSPGLNVTGCNALLLKLPLPNGWAYRHDVQEYPSTGCNFLFNRMSSEDFEDCELPHVYIFSLSGSSFDSTLKFIVLAWACLFSLQLCMPILMYLFLPCEICCCRDKKYVSYYTTLYLHVWTGGMCSCCPVMGGDYGNYMLPLPLFFIYIVKDLIETIGIPYLMVGNCPVCDFPLSFAFLIIKSVFLFKEIAERAFAACSNYSSNRISPKDPVDTAITMPAAETNVALVNGSPQAIHVMSSRDVPRVNP
jgi:hypothetical protein